MKTTAHDSLVIVPTYNELENLEPLATQILEQPGFDVLVIDDNSPDGTGELADHLAERWPDRMTILHCPGKQGLGRALLRGFQHALDNRYPFVFQMDGDLSHDPTRLPAMRETLEEADVVVGSRYCPGGRTDGWPAWRQALSRLGAVYASFLLGMGLKDLTGGYKGFHDYVLQTFKPEEVKSTGYAFQVEVNYLCLINGFNVVEVPITFLERVHGRSKMTYRIVLEALLVVAQLRLSHNSHSSGNGSSRDR
jgi:dolichol-phosphate mannosyltransferase